jgi:hypothetical protein
MVKLLLVAPAVRGEEVVLLPEEFSLHGPASKQRLLVERVRDGSYVGQVEDGIHVVSSDPHVVRVEKKEGGLVALPVGNGEAQLTVKVGGKTATAAVIVSNHQDSVSWTFRNHVVSVMAKTGCNSGACHGAVAGKNGFRLSLRGYDPHGDFNALTRHASSRRVIPSDPGRSLLLLKPTGALPHKGGVRFSPDSLDYRVVSEWIAAGMPPPRDEDPRIERLEIIPAHVVLDPGARQQLLVRAHFSDGHLEDVTHWAKYTATNTAVAEVDDQGQLSITGHGEGAVSAWYLSHIVVATLTVPYPLDLSQETFTRAERRNFIDQLVLEKLESLNLPPSPQATDSEFLRRAFMDTIGVLPTVEETRSFLLERRSDKRDRLIESLLERPEFVDYWTYKWSDLLLVRGRLGPEAMWAYANWIRDAVSANTPWDEMVRSLVTATGSTFENGAANFFDLHDDPYDMAETTSVAFLGMSINCARCHNHPMEKWTNNQYYGFVNLFARVRAKVDSTGNRIVFTATSGDVIQPLTGRPQAPRPLDAEPLDIHAPEDRRLYLATWLTSPENPYFARSITNRVWANFLGVGLVEKVDDLRRTNPSSNEKLLTAAARFLIEQDFNLKALMRAILQSKTYQASSRPLPGNLEDRRFYSRFYPRRLMAEVLLDAISQVTGAPSEFPGYPPSWRALQIPDPAVASYFLESFGRPKREITCACERSAEPSMAQVLHLTNGDTINKKVAAKGNHIERLLATKASDEKIIEELYLRALCRYPKPPEKKKLLEILSETRKSASGETSSEEERRLATEDLYWSVLTSKEFLFNH